MPKINGDSDDLRPTPGLSSPGLGARDGEVLHRERSPGSPPASSPPVAHHELSAHLDAAFHHESAAFHHRQAAFHAEAGRPGEAERHLWAAFGHSLNAHESTRARLSGSRGGASPDFGHDHDSTKGSVDPEPRA